MSREEILAMMWNIPGSYEDFVNDTTDWMMRDNNIQRAILEQLRNNPDSNTDDLTRVLWNILGIGKPLEILDDNGDVEIKTA